MDEEFVFTYQSTSGAINLPTVVVDAVNEGTLEKVIYAKEKPSNNPEPTKFNPEHIEEVERQTKKSVQFQFEGSSLFLSTSPTKS